MEQWIRKFEFSWAVLRYLFVWVITISFTWNLFVVVPNDEFWVIKYGMIFSFIILTNKLFPIKELIQYKKSSDGVKEG